MITLASSRATSARITSPAGRRATPSRWTTLQTDGERLEHARAPALRCPPGVTIRRWIMRRSLAAGAGGPAPPAPAVGYPAKNSSRAATAVSGKSENSPSMPSAKNSLYSSLGSPP